MKKLVDIVKHVPIVKFVWTGIRERYIFYRHYKVASFWRNVIQQYCNNAIERYILTPKKEILNNKIIWQYWGQGLNEEELPEVVRICFASVDKNKGDYQVIRL